MSAAERIEWWSDHPVLLWCPHPCDEIWDALGVDVANDNSRSADALAPHTPEQPNRAATSNKLSHLPLARGATASTRQGRGDAFRSALLAGANRVVPMGCARTSVGRGLTPSKKYLPFFWDGDPMSFDYGDQPTTAYGRQRYDAFGRQVQTFDLDGTITLQSRYHALSTDLWDAADLSPGQHQGSYASERKDGHGRTAQTTERFRDHGSLEERHVRTTYLPSGEPTSITRVSAGETPITRWMQYDSLGRMVLNVEPNTTSGFVVPENLAAPAIDYSSLKAWRYQYNYFGDLIATSDARGCGQNFYYDGAGRILGEDYAPCEDHHEAYSAPSGGTDYANLEVAYFYDSPAAVSSLSGVAPSGWTGSEGSGVFTLGRAVAVLDRGSASFTTYDGRGRTKKTQTKIAVPRTLDVDGKPAPIPSIANRYAPRVYARSMSYDAADREVSATTGAAELVASDGTTKLVPELLNSDGESACTTEYSARGAVKEASSSYGSLVSSITRSADNLVSEIVYGDAANTTTTYLYDERRRISSVQTYRGSPESVWNDHPASTDEPTQQLVLQDEDFIYDVVGNPVEIRDWRDPQDWPDGAKPVTKKIEYDDLYRATRIKYEYSAGDDDWTSPFQADIDGSVANDDDRRGKPSPHVEFTKRMLEQTFEYDWVGNNRKTGDDAGGFYDRSLGAIDDDDEAGKPYQLKGATLSGARGGSLQARYDAAGNMTKMQLARNGDCIGGAAGDCNQQFRYEWDEVGRLARARRWDNDTTNVDTFDPATTATPVAADLRYTYDASDQRVLKEAVDLSSPTTHSYTAYIFETLELRRAQFGAYGEAQGAQDYEINHYTVVPYLLANGVRLSRIVYHASGDVPDEDYDEAGAPGDVNGYEPPSPAISEGKLHVFFELGDHLGSTSVVLDKATGELVERATFQGYGGAESDYRPNRWKSFREDYRFTGKEEDVEVGLQYFGKRYLNPLLGRWISADPLAVHAPGEADLNVYAYVKGAVLKSIDPLGLADDPSPAMQRSVGAESGPAEVDQLAEHGEQAEWGTPEHPAYQQGPSMQLELEAEDVIYGDADGDGLAGPHHQGLEAIAHGTPGMREANLRREFLTDAGYVGLDVASVTVDVATLGIAPTGEMTVARRMAMTSMKKPVLRMPEPVRLNFSEIAGTASRTAKKAPFNPTGSSRNCVNGVCSFIESVSQRSLVQASADVAENGGSVVRAMEQIQARTGIRYSSEVQRDALVTGKARQFFVVFRRGAGAHDHVAVGMVNKGRRLIYDPQTGERFWDVAEFGPFDAYPILIP